jgi:hypothetical protein
MRGRAIGTVVAILLFAWIATAALSHAAIEAWASIGASPDPYNTHPHGGPLIGLIGAASLLLGLGFLEAANAIARRSRRDPVAVLLTRLSRIPKAVSVPVVASGGSAILILMELLEQLRSFGHPSGIGDAFGGNVIFGLLIVCVIAALVAIFGCTALRAVLTSVVRAIIVCVAWIGASHSGSNNATKILHRANRHLTWMTASHARVPTLRAPPNPIVS